MRGAITVWVTVLGEGASVLGVPVSVLGATGVPVSVGAAGVPVSVLGATGAPVSVPGAAGAGFTAVFDPLLSPPRAGAEVLDDDGVRAGVEVPGVGVVVLSVDDVPDTSLTTP